MTAPQRPVWLPDTKGFLAIAIIALFAGTLLLLLFGRAPTDDKIMTALTLLLGVLANEIKEVYGYFFGSSASSANKDETQMRLTEKLADRAVAAEPVVPAVAPVVMPTVVPTNAAGGPYATPMEPRK